MKKKILIVFLIILQLTCTAASVFANNKPDIDAKYALLTDAKTGKYLYKKGSDKKIAPGGFTKIMTAIIAIESMVEDSETVVAKSDTVASYDYSFGHMGILAGEILTLEDLINGMLIYDAGDAAEVIASYSTGSRESFISKMNSKAVEIGALNTKFTNPTGFPDKKQYTTLEDICKITRYAMELDYFKEVVAKRRYEMEPTNKYKQKRYLDNKNHFLNSTATDEYYTMRAKGVKTSYIDKKNIGVILSYESDNASFLSFVAGASSEVNTYSAYNDTKKLLNYGLDFYTSVKAISEGDILAEVELINGRGTDRLLLEADEDIFVNLPKDYDEDKLSVNVVLEDKIKAPISKGKILGSVTILYNGEEYISTPLTSPIEVKANPIKGFFTIIWRFITKPILLVSLGIILIIIVWSTLIFNKKKNYKIDKKRQK